MVVVVLPAVVSTAAAAAAAGAAATTIAFRYNVRRFLAGVFFGRCSCSFCHPNSQRRLSFRVIFPVCRCGVVVLWVLLLCLFGWLVVLC
jgi:hypothetical protein